MKVKIKKLEGTARQLDIEMPKDVVSKAFEEVLEDIRKTAKIPGFRPGKAPIDIVRKRFMDDARDEVQRRLIPMGYQMALNDKSITPVSYPEVSEVSLELSGEFKFTAKVDVEPECDIKKYKGLKVEKEKVVVADEEVKEALERIRNMHAEFEKIDRPLGKGDFAICDVETYMDGKPISSKRNNMWIEVDKEVSLLGMGEALVGMKPGDKKDINVKLPKDYPDEKYADKDAVFSVEVKDTREKKVPELDDEFAKKIGKETSGQVEEEIKGQLSLRKEANAKVNMKNQIIEQLIKKHSFDVPGSMVERQMKVLMDRAENELLQKGVSAEAIGKHKEELNDKLYREAEDKVRVYFILSRIADCEDIQVEEKELEDWFASMAMSYNQDVEKVREYYEKNDLVDGLKEQLREDKTLEFLLSEAAVTEKA
ncbi:MAG: trigger factor [Candidatus Omnitrophica bacterium]|nr:trigger factor [Candidatus Omnitrophota bacterium]MDD5487597.1 trigger factor [Candidatus Omnitrophota bacterium]